MGGVEGRMEGAGEGAVGGGEKAGLLQLGRQVGDLAGNEVAVGQQRAGGQGVDPVPVPQQVQHLRVQRRLRSPAARRTP